MSHHLRIKICGITTPEDAQLAAELGADAIGLNFYPRSPRYVSDVAAINGILIELPPFVEAVGVFVNETWRKATFLAKRYSLRTVQMHGLDHTPGYRFPMKRIDAFRIQDQESLQEIRRYLDRARELGQMPAAVLVDGYHKGLLGGTGQTAPWDMLADFNPGVPLILAGGLTPENVAQAVRIVRPYAVDVASGVESAPGRKDVEKMKRFIDNARSAC
jgi:phosphoribosylanthranilate isomerase